MPNRMQAHARRPHFRQTHDDDRPEIGRRLVPRSFNRKAVRRSANRVDLRSHLSRSAFSIARLSGMRSSACCVYMTARAQAKHSQTPTCSTGVLIRIFRIVSNACGGEGPGDKGSGTARHHGEPPVCRHRRCERKNHCGDDRDRHGERGELTKIRAGDDIGQQDAEATAEGKRQDRSRGNQNCGRDSQSFPRAALRFAAKSGACVFCAAIFEIF
jgi:hypothetical protein